MAARLTSTCFAWSCNTLTNKLQPIKYKLCDCFILQATGYQNIHGTAEDRKKEQQEYGVFYDDDYDYLQHLKTRTDTSLEPLPSNVTVIEARKPDVKKARLIIVGVI